MLSYEDIVEAPLGKLKAAADDWSEMTAKLDKLADHASDGMKAKADKASWEGLNAGVTKAFVGKTVKEFADAAAEAKGVRTLLEEGYAAFKKAKDDLINIRDHEVAFLPATAAVGTAAVLIPLATDTASGAMEQVIGQVIGDVSDNSVDEHKEKVEDLNEEERKKVYSAGESLAESPMQEFTSSITGDGDICQVFANDAALSDRLEVTWELTGGPPKGEPASKFTVLRMGERALTAADAGAVQFACRSGKLSGSLPAHIDIGVERWSPKDPEGDPEKLKDAYATVAHSFALAMAKELGCENDGGLETRPSLDPA